MGPADDETMNFETITSFLAMGGYATYVFASYGLTALTLGGLLLAESRRHRVWLRRQAALRRVEEA